MHVALSDDVKKHMNRYQTLTEYDIENIVQEYVDEFEYSEDEFGNQTYHFQLYEEDDDVTIFGTIDFRDNTTLVELVRRGRF